MISLPLTLHVPTSVHVNELISHPTDSKVEEYLSKLQERYLVAKGTFGPFTYYEEPKRDPSHICYWSEEAKRFKYPPLNPIIIIGASTEVIYFVMSKDITGDPCTFMREHTPLDKIIYRISWEMFNKTVDTLYS